MCRMPSACSAAVCAGATGCAQKRGGMVKGTTQRPGITLVDPYRQPRNKGASEALGRALLAQGEPARAATYTIRSVFLLHAV